MRVEVLIPIFLSFPFGLLIFIALTRSIQAHLRSFMDKLSFFLWPYPPARMLIVQELDGEINIYYDDDYEEVQSENRTMIRTIDGMQYVTELPPSEASITVSLFNARGPEHMPTPFSLAWRWIVATGIMIYFFYWSLITAWIPPIEVREVEYLGKVLTIAEQQPLDPWEAMIATTLFFSFLTWYIVNIIRMNDATIAYAWYHAKGINPPHVAIVPVPGISSVGLLEYLEKLGRKIEIIIPRDVGETIRKALEEVKGKVGSKSLAAVILAKLAMAKTWRQALANILRERFDMRKAGEAAAMIRLGIKPITKKMIPAVILLCLLSFGIGFVFGSAFSIGVQPVNTSITTPPSIPPSYPPYYPPSTNATSPMTTPPFKPASPPPPPTG